MSLDAPVEGVFRRGRHFPGMRQYGCRVRHPSRLVTLPSKFIPCSPQRSDIINFYHKNIETCGEGELKNRQKNGREGWQTLALSVWPSECLLGTPLQRTSYISYSMRVSRVQARFLKTFSYLMRRPQNLLISDEAKPSQIWEGFEESGVEPREQPFRELVACTSKEFDARSYSSKPIENTVT